MDSSPDFVKRCFAVARWCDLYINAVRSGDERRIADAIEHIGGYQEHVVWLRTMHWLPELVKGHPAEYFRMLYRKYEDLIRRSRGLNVAEYLPDLIGPYFSKLRLISILRVETNP